jgi:translocation and assembly module TamB
MPEERGEKTEGLPVRRRRYFTRRNTFIAAVFLAVLLVLIAIVGVVTYRYGVYDNYVKAMFVAKMDDMGMAFEAEVFRLTVNPLELELKNATFKDKLTGEKLFFVRDAHLAMTVQDLYAWQLSRYISIDTTDINGAEVWVQFDENGRSNFANLRFVENEPGTRVNFKYKSIDFKLADSVVHFGDLSRNISGNAKNVLFLLSPENRGVADDQKRYNFDLTSTNSNFVYNQSSIEDIDIRATGIADNHGAQVTTFDLKTPIGESTMTGTLTDWASPKYDFDIQSTVDLTQASSILPIGTSLVGVGNFHGKVTGEGEAYKIVGEADAASLRAGGISLKGINVAATVAGTNSDYEANGKAVAELLTFEDFRVDFLKLSGNVRGTGTDFRWLGELQAAAASSRNTSLGGLFLSDAYAEHRDRELRAGAASGKAQKFSVKDTQFADLWARNIKIQLDGDLVSIAAPVARSSGLKSKDYSLQGLTGQDLTVRHRNETTNVEIAGVKADTGELKNIKAKGVSVGKFSLTDVPRTTKITGRGLRVAELNAAGARVVDLEAPTVDLENVLKGPLNVYSDKVRVASIDSDSAVLGSINIGGVRMTIVQGRVEARSNDIDAGNVTLKKTATLKNGGTLEAVKVSKPVYILEPSGRYRATADMSLGGGAIGSVALGNAASKVEVTNDRIALNELTASVMNGQVSGKAVIALNDRTQSTVTSHFSDLDISKLLALQSGRIIPLEGQTTGNIDITFNGTHLRTASGTINADITANAGTAESGLIPISGQVKLNANNGLFNVELADLRTANSSITSSGRFDLKDQNSNLTLALRSTDASEIERLVRVLGVSTELERQIDSLQVTLAGSLAFDATLTGNLSDPTIDGKASLASVSMHGREIGSVSTDVFRSPAGLELRNGKLQEGGGGNAVFTVSVPSDGTNNASVKATLTNVNAGNLLAALPIDLPERIRDFDGQTSGTVDISGLPNNARGEINVAAAKGMIAGQAFDNLNVKAVFNGTRIDLERAEMQIGTGRLSASGSIDRASSDFTADVIGKGVPFSLLLTLFPRTATLPVVTGDLDFTANATGNFDRPSTYNVSFNGLAPNVLVNESSLGNVAFTGKTVNQILTADLTANLDGHPQTISASVNLADQNLPFTAATDFNQSPLAPFIAFIPQLKDLAITGTGTGRIEFGGNLSTLDANGNRIYTSANLTGTAQFSQLALVIQDTALAAAEPVVIRFSPREINFEHARFSGGGSNMTIAGTKALTVDGINNLSIDGRVNLTLLNLIAKDTFFAGFADTSVRLSGPNATARLVGTANVVNGSVSTFLGTDRFTVDRLKARVIFTSNQVEVEETTGYLGGGKFTGSGGGVLDGLAIRAFRFSLDGNNVTVPLPQDFVTTGDAQLEITGVRENPAQDLQVTISGRVYARKSIYSKDIDLASLVSGRREPILSTGGTLTVPRFDLVIEGRDALIVKNNIADLTASVSLALTGDANNPQLSGRITANSGTILFRKDRYQIQRAVLEFPPDTEVDPVINLQGETEIAGYQIFVNLSGPLRESEDLTVTMRSSPALPQADVVSLITTGNLTNTAGGISTLAQTGINTAAEVLTDAIINTPIRKATDKLFGLNVFEIDPIISGQNFANPGARLTVGRQINNKLKVTYSTNLSQDQNQILAFEYRVSNKLSFVAQYEHRELSNVTRNRDNFSFEVRFRRRF